MALVMLAMPRLLVAQDDLPQGHHPLPEEGDIVGQIKTVTATQGDTLIDLGLSHGLGYNAVTEANPETRIWLPGEGTQVLLPTRFILPPGPREGIVINLAELRLYYYRPASPGAPPRVETYPIGIGRMDWKTPLGTTKITAKLENPTWYPPASIIAEHAERGEELDRVVPPGPDNPLGEYAMILDIPGYLIHGTNKPDGVGMRVSHGCIRMLSGDIEDLIYRVPKGTEVRLINQPVKFGWTPRGLLEMQAYPVPEESPEKMASRIADAFDTATQEANARGLLVDYARLKAELQGPTGVARSLLLASAPITVKRTFYDRLTLHHALYSQLAATVDATEKDAAANVNGVPVEER
ncbi:L,D-transpeptidase ErfK/SrfK [Modicisalibacter ilicicola DSM 19980]|uniref:L,D-transpeptidase ErfK/SrfK n=1 Tax=Modicisalibacter ilicicola DSM 19980 TaxID=1121942 RepID=A0A1M4T2D8_9GAMM|nr:L,D-transpeptidase family protein [Halomonas ilicicola]SHE38558.1 L,D-transpeptidase ErfK/SrfK [Halomonas ilicicola DSM 19980]